MELMEVALQITVKAMEMKLLDSAGNNSYTVEGATKNAEQVNAFYTSVYDNLVTLYNRDI